MNEKKVKFPESGDPCNLIDYTAGYAAVNKQEGEGCKSASHHYASAVKLKYRHRSI